MRITVSSCFFDNILYGLPNFAITVTLCKTAIKIEKNINDKCLLNEGGKYCRMLPLDGRGLMLWLLSDPSGLPVGFILLQY